jgi:hypothetical protein
MMVFMMSSVEDCSTQEIAGSADAELVERLAGTARGEIGGEELATPEHDPVGRRISGRQKDRKFNTASELGELPESTQRAACYNAIHPDGGPSWTRGEGPVDLPELRQAG